MREGLLTAINETIVVLGVSFRSIPFSLEDNGGHSLGFAVSVVMKCDILQWADGALEEILKKTVNKGAQGT